MNQIFEISFNKENLKYFSLKCTILNPQVKTKRFIKQLEYPIEYSHSQKDRSQHC